MKKNKFHYAISGYRWAPESFQASKGLTKSSMKIVPLTAEEQKETGILSLTKGPDVAIGYVKHIERARERQRRKVILRISHPGGTETICVLPAALFPR